MTRQINAEQTLQAIVEKIRVATTADLVVLYPYEARNQRFLLPPCIAGDLLDSGSLVSMSPNRPDGAAKQILRRARPIFAQQVAGLPIGTDPNDSHIRQGGFGKREQIARQRLSPCKWKTNPSEPYSSIFARRSASTRPKSFRRGSGALRSHRDQKCADLW